MPKPDLLPAILAIESLDELTAFLNGQPVSTLARQLYSLFDAHAEYDDANQWAAAVRICEALAIVGWGLRERVDAISRFNGDHQHTSFVNAEGEERFRAGPWTKRKAGWVLFHPEFHASPDWPDRPSVDWLKYAPGDHPICDRPDLPSQRNYQKPMPIVMGLVGGENKTTQAVLKLRTELDALLRQSMHPALYGEALEKFYFRLLCPFPSESPPAGLKVGTFNVKQRAFTSDLGFDDPFGQLAGSAQREYLAANLLAAVDALKTRLDKRQIEYDINRFRADVAAAIGKFLEQKMN